jgi:hypothetical protein
MSRTITSHCARRTARVSLGSSIHWEVTATKRPAAGVALALALALALAGCGGSASVGGGGAQARQAQAALAPASGANPVAAPPIGDVALTTGTQVQRIRHTVAAFYRAAWEDDAQGACALFSPAGRAGFMRAAKISFPASINRFSTCAEAMKIYNATLTASIEELQNSDPSVSSSALNDVAVGDVAIHGAAATAIGPTNALPMINPKRISLVRSGPRWLIAGSYTLNKSTLPQTLKHAEQKGAFRRRHRR